jgi:hypothetical protein
MKKLKVRKGNVPGNGKPAMSERIAELPNGMWECIAKKAYELYEQRGRKEGRALEDWLDAETIVMEQIHEARE